MIIVFKYKSKLSESPNCRLLNSPSSFNILDQASTEYDLRINEAVYIQLHRPSLNKQVKQSCKFKTFFVISLLY